MSVQVMSRKPGEERVNALISIKACYIERILNGSKKYELRKSKPGKQVKKFFVYVPAPVQKILYTFVPGRIIEDTPQNLWKRIGHLSGLTEEEFLKYFNGAKKGVAIEILNFRKLPEPLCIEDILPGKKPPQSFLYMSFFQT